MGQSTRVQGAGDIQDTLDLFAAGDNGKMGK